MRFLGSSWGSSINSPQVLEITARGQRGNPPHDNLQPIKLLVIKVFIYQTTYSFHWIIKVSLQGERKAVSTQLTLHYKRSLILVEWLSFLFLSCTYFPHHWKIKHSWADALKPPSWVGAPGRIRPTVVCCLTAYLWPTQLHGPPTTRRRQSGPHLYLRGCLHCGRR